MAKTGWGTKRAALIGNLAGATQNELLSEKNRATTFSLAYGKTDQTGQSQIEQVTNNGNTAYVEHDPVTGQPLLLRTSSGTQSIYVYDGTGSPATLLTSFTSRPRLTSALRTASSTTSALVAATSSSSGSCRHTSQTRPCGTAPWCTFTWPGRSAPTF